MPNSIYQWRCTPDASNFTLAAATHSPLLQSSECPSGQGSCLQIAGGSAQADLPALLPVLQLLLLLLPAHMLSAAPHLYHLGTVPVTCRLLCTPQADRCRCCFPPP